MDGVTVWGMCLLFALLFFVLMFGFSIGEGSVKKEIRQYGCDAVVKTWNDKP